MCIINKGFIPITMKTKTRDDTPPLWQEMGPLSCSVEGLSILHLGPRTREPAVEQRPDGHLASKL